MMTGSASAGLHQEFRNLESLDAITALHFESKLPRVVVSDIRSQLVSSYRKYKGTNDMPRNLHLAIQWNKNDLFLADDIKDVMKDELLGKLIDEKVNSPDAGKEAEATEVPLINPNIEEDNEATKVIWKPSTPICSKRKPPYDASKAPLLKHRHGLTSSPTSNLFNRNERVLRGPGSDKVVSMTRLLHLFTIYGLNHVRGGQKYLTH